MPRPVFPRSSGRRGPQVGPGTFVGRSSSTAVDPGGPFTVVAWSPGPEAPSTELWCMHSSFSPIAPAVTGSHYLFMEQVEEPHAFVPPSGSSATSLATTEALKDHARVLRYDLHALPSTPGDWTVHAGAPEPVAGSASPIRLANGVYGVGQVDRGSAETPVAWVWVSGNGSRELWLYHRPNEPTGFQFLGLRLEGQAVPYVASTFRFRRFEPPDLGSWNTNYDLFESKEKFKNAVLHDVNSPVTDPDSLLFHDLHVKEYP